MSNVQLYHGDCLEFMRTLPAGSVDAVVTDPPYGMGKGDWDKSIPEWLHLVKDIPTAVFCGVIGMRDYPTPDWIGAWVRAGSTQRNGKFRGFNNWEPILFYWIHRLDNDVISVPNYHEDTGHPTTKPLELMKKLISKMPAGTVLDPFMGSGTTGVACVQTGRSFIGCEIDAGYFEIARKRIAAAEAQPRLLTLDAPPPRQEEMAYE
jgi:site-specific DNA-methyltransferase (adenine-specific)